MNKTILLTLSIILVLGFSQSIAGEMRYVDREKGFSIQVPKGWNKTTKKKYLVKHAIYTIRTGAARISVIPYSDISLEDAVEAMAKPFRDAKAKQLKQEYVDFHGVPGHFTEWKLGAEYAYIGVMKSGNKGFILSGIMPTKTAKQTRKMLRTIMSDFEMLLDCEAVVEEESRPQTPVVEPRAREPQQAQIEEVQAPPVAMPPPDMQPADDQPKEVDSF